MATTPAPTTPGAVRVGGWAVVGIVAGLGMLYGLAAMHDGTIAAGTTTMTPATAVGVAVLCYLAAAATGVRWVAWAGIPVFSGVAFAGLLGILPWWALIALAGGVLLAVGIVRGARTVTTIQAAAMLGYFGIAVVALFPTPRVGLALAGVVLAAHAVWDVIHYRRNVVVDRAFTVFCIGLDLTVGLVCLGLALVG